MPNLKQSGNGLMTSGSSDPSATPQASMPPGYMPYDPTQSAAQNSSNMIQNENQNYETFMQNMPQYQNNMNNQTIDQGNQAYNNAKDKIDTSANKRGLLYSGIKQGAESGAATAAANETQEGIANNNANLQNYASGYGNQVAGNNANYYANTQQAALNTYGNWMQQGAQNQQFIGGLLGGGGTALGKVL